MANLFDIANLITTVGVDGVKIKQEPGVPEKSSNEILTELFSTFDVDGGAASSADNSDVDDNDPDKTKKKKKKSKKKHKHKDKKHKKKSKKYSSGSESESDTIGGKKNKKHRKKIKKRKYSSSNSDSDEIKVKKELSSPSVKRKRKDSRTSSFEGVESKTVFDLVQSVVIKNEPGLENNNKLQSKFDSPKSPELTRIFTNLDDDLKESIVPRLMEKTDQLSKGKIQIKDLKNSTVYNETVKEVENKQKEKAALMEDGELSESDFDNRTPTLSPTPPPELLASSDRSSITELRNSAKRDLRLMLNRKVKAKSGTERSRSRRDRNSRDADHKDHQTKENKNRDRKRSRSCHSKDRKDSDSLYSRKRSKSRDRERHRTRSNDRRHRDSSDRRLPRSRERSSRYSESHFDSWSRGDDKSRDRQWRGRSRSHERKERIEIDKKKLLEIARKNAITMIKRGTLPLAQQDKAIAAIQAGGKSVEELIDFCKSLSKSEALGELSSVSSENGGSDTEKGFHHPFLLKERPNSIVMNIRDSKQLPTKTFQERTAESSNQLRLQFPVSSGQQHRKTENEWIEVIPPAPVKKPEPKKTFVPGSTPLQPQAFSIIPPVNSGTSGTANSTPKPAPTVDPVVVAPVPLALPPTNPTPAIVPVAGPPVFPQPVVENVDIGTIVSQRLAAMRKLRENPHDVEALTEMYHAQSEMKSWAESKQMPGQFTGSTGVKVLSAAELTSGYQAWARKDQLTSAQPVSGGMGMALLQKMGWRPGEGLGKNKEGTLEPLQLEVKLDKRGLVSNQDIGVRPGKTVGKPIIPTIKTLEGKHPVSLLGEYCSKKKFGAPVYELCFECGPDHKKNFLFKVKVNGIEYKPTVASPNKKQAKAEAAQICLQTLGLLPSQG